MPYENISASLTQEAVIRIKESVANIKKSLPFLVNLTPEERANMLKLGNKSISFVTKALDYAKNNPGLVPPYVNIAEMEKDFNLARALLEINNILSSLAEGVDDTTMATGSEAFNTALAFYNSVKQAAKMNVPGTDSIYQDLKERFTKTSGEDDGDEPEAGV